MDLYHGAPGDDASIAAVRVRKRHPVNVMIGPPADRSQDRVMMNLFFSKEGERIICGGTTAGLAAEFLGKEVVPSLKFDNPEVPPISQIEGIDLVTEGVLTLSKVLHYTKSATDGSIEDWRSHKDGASLITQALLDRATDVNFYVGQAVNPAHQGPNVPIAFHLKLQLIEQLAERLRAVGKHVKLSYF